MEDFEAAYKARAVDTETLHQQKRRTAAMHLGGVSIECLLKAMIVNFYELTEWKTDNNNPGHTIHNPEHHLIKEIKTINK
jgi:hypothetical protein